MRLTIFSLFMAVVWSSVIIIIQYIFIKKRNFVRIYGISSIIMLYAFLIIRMTIPVELPFTKGIENVYLWNRLYQYLCIEEIKVFGKIVSRANLLIWIWLTGTILLSASFIIKYNKTVSKINCFEERQDNQINIFIEKINKIIGKKFTVKVRISTAVNSPLGFGLLKKTILLPERNYSQEELFYILLHEMTHFANRDIFLKMLTQFFCYLFWWNPVVYLLRKDLAQTLEIKCDLVVVANMDRNEIINYLTTIVHVIQGQNSENHSWGFETVSIVGSNSAVNLVERFRIVSDNERGKGRLAGKIIWYASLICIALLSYSFVTQPEYYPLEEEIVTDENTFEITKENTYLILKANGTYLLVHNSGYEQIIKTEIAKGMVSEGYELKREREKNEKE